MILETLLMSASFLKAFDKHYSLVSFLISITVSKYQFCNTNQKHTILLVAR